MVVRPDAYLTSRAAAMQSVESTIHELGGIFQQLAHMVGHEAAQIALCGPIEAGLLHTCVPCRLHTMSDVYLYWIGRGFREGSAAHNHKVISAIWQTMGSCLAGPGAG